MQSLPAAWAEHDRLVGTESDDESVPDLESESESEPEEGSESVVVGAEVEAPVVPPAPEYFEITPGGCGTKGCTFKHGHDGHCSGVVVLARRRGIHAEQHLEGVAARSSPARLTESLVGSSVGFVCKMDFLEWSRAVTCVYRSRGSARASTRVISSFLLGCVRLANLVLQICRDEHLGIDANTSQFRLTFRVSRSV